LETNSSITYLNLSGNATAARHPEGTSAIVSALYMNDTLRRLVYNSNLIPADYMLQFAECLKYNHSLTSLSLCNNANPQKLFGAFEDALKNNKTMIELELSESKHSGRSKKGGGLPV